MDKSHDSNTHTLVLLFDFVGVKGLEHGCLPRLLALAPVADKLPKFLEGFDLLLTVLDCWALSCRQFKVHLLGIDLLEAFREALKSRVDLVDHLVVLVLTFAVVVLLELFNLLLNIVQLFLEGFGLDLKAALNIVTLRLERDLLRFNSTHDAVGLLVSELDLFDILVSDLNMRHPVQHHQPVN